MAVSFTISEQDQLRLGCVAVQAIETWLRDRQLRAPDPQDYPESLRQPLGVFVTLTSRGALRGCIGLLAGSNPLVTNVWRMALSAAFEDSRFPPLRSERECRGLDMEITVLDRITPCPDPKEIVIGRHGLVLRKGGRSGVFLPQVPVEQGWNLTQYLNHLCDKASLPRGSWRDPDARLLWYEGFAFPVNWEAAAGRAPLTRD